MLKAMALALAVSMSLTGALAPRVSSAHTQNEPDPPGTMIQADPFRALAQAADEAARRVAARAALRSLAEAAAPTAAAWLAEEPATTLRLLAGAAETQADAEALAGAVVRALRQGDNGEAQWAFEPLTPDARAAALGVLARSQEAVSCQVLVAWLEQTPSAQRGPIAAALSTMTGRDDLAASPQAWRQWLGRHQHLPPLAWRGLLAEGLRQRAERLAQRERDLVARLAEGTRRYYAALPQAERPAAMTLLLADAEPAVRLLATDLLLRDLERGLAPGPETAAALVGLLDDPQAPLRQAAAVLIDRIVPAGSAARLSVALRREVEPEVATVMLRAYRRAPDPAAVDALLRWLEHGEPTFLPAVRAILSLLETGYTPSDDQRDRVRAALEPRDPALVQPAEVLVRVRLAGQGGPQTARAWLASDRPEIRRAAAEALSAFAEGVDDVLTAAADDPAMLQRAADAVARHKPWAPYLRRIARLEMNLPPDPAAAQPLPITASLAAFVPIGERLAAAQELARSPLAVRAILGQPQREQFPPGPTGDRAYARARSLLGLPAPEPPATTQEPAGTQEPDGPQEPVDPGGVV